MLSGWLHQVPSLKKKLLDPDSSNYLAALVRVREGENNDCLAIAWIDLSTGSFHLCCTELQTLSAYLARLEPRELVFSQNLTDDERYRNVLQNTSIELSPQPANLFDSAFAVQRLQSFFQVKSLDGMGNFSRVELAAAAAIIAYVEKNPAPRASGAEFSGTTLRIRIHDD